MATMDMVMTFTNHLGDSIVLGDPGGSLHYFENEIRDWEWEVNEINGGISSFTRKLIKKNLPVGIAAKSAEEGLELRDTIYELAEQDILENKPGRLSLSGWYIDCFITACSFDNYYFDERFCEMDLDLVIPKPGWIKEVLTEFDVDALSPQAENGFLDYPFDFPFDFKPPQASKILRNDAMAPCDFLIRIEGPATNPSVNIGGNLYQVNVSVPDGGRLEINSREHTIELFDKYGNVTNCFNDRLKGNVESGNYIWQPIPTGVSNVAWDNTFKFFVVLYHLRSTVPWIRSSIQTTNE